MPQATTKRVVHKSAAYSPSLGTDRSGTIFTTRGAAAEVDFTLPKPGFQYLGTEYTFVNVVDQTLGVLGKSAGDILTLNNNAAASVKASTGGQKIGAVIQAKCVESAAGTFKWLVYGVTVGVAYTVA